MPAHRSHWMRDAVPTRTGSPSSDRYDLLVVGAGLTGLWTAYHAKRRDPDRSVLVVEAERVGFGASGRNGGWLSDLLPGNRAVWERTRGHEAVVAMQRAVSGSVHDVLATLAEEGIDADQHLGGRLSVARTPAGMRRFEARAAADESSGLAAQLLDAGEVRARIQVDGAVGGLFGAGTAVLHPGQLVRGLADLVGRLGVEVVEGVRASELAPGRVATTAGEIRAEAIACCTEGYSGPLLGERGVVPVNSSMIVTTPLSDEVWGQIGWGERFALNDAAHTFVYAQRTADGRIAIGGRGSPYRFGSGTGDGSVDPATVRALTARLADFFPGVDLPVERAWSGVLGVTRDWCATVREADGVAAAAGYAGHGVAATSLAARTMLDRLDHRSTELTALPWNDHDPGRWEPEPLRWLGIHGMYRLFRAADAWEEYRGSMRTSLLARIGGRLAGLD